MKRYYQIILMFFVITPLMAGCLTVRFVEPYDAVLDEGLTSLQGNTAAFVARMGAVQSKPEGQFNSVEVQEFYARNEAIIAGFVERAKILDTDKSCLPANFVGDGIKKLADNTAELLTDLNMPYGDVEGVAKTIQSFGDGSDEISVGNCTVVILKVVQANYSIMKTLHKKKGKLSPVFGQIVGGIVGDSIRIAIKNELTKKNR
ncbi:MAG: hypothetical protein OQK24_03050 [Magnetovibrio sp.]|nr:hypothetical protein [Magnetovibrio sp.]